MDEGVPVTIAVVDADTGALVGGAEVRLVAGTERHPVDPHTGAATLSVEVMPNGSELFFVHGMSLAMTVSAPGYRATAIEHLVPRGRRRPVEVALEPLAWSPAPESPALVHELQIAWTRWVAASEAWTSTADPALLPARNAARVQVASLAEDWAAWTGASPADRALAAAICASATSRPTRCAP